MSMPSSFSARTACSLGGSPSTAPTPADITRKSFRPLTACRKSPSAMGLRQILPVQTKRIVFIQLISRLNLLGSRMFVNAKSTGAELLHHGEPFEQIQSARQHRVAHNSPGALDLTRGSACFIFRVETFPQHTDQFGFIETAS